MKDQKPRIPDREHVSEAVRRLNHHLWPEPNTPAAGATAAAPVPLSPKTGQPRKGRVPNKTEQRFLDICEARKRRGEIDSYRYEGMRLAWGRDEKTGSVMHYTPDVVIFCGDRITLAEVKGAHVRSRDIVRFKGCRAEWGEFRFEMHQFARGEWRRL